MAPMDDTPQQIGRYRIERKLGAGSMGNVYLAHDGDLDRPVAIKTVRDLGLDEHTRELFLQRFKNEARAAARLHHPNIVQIFDVGDDPTVGPYLVFEYVDGKTLKDRLRAGPLSPQETVDVAAQMAGALDTAHIAGVIHRDLKPENLLLTESGQVKLADFGIARVPNATLTREGQFLGTPCYSAPETLRRGEYSVKSDLFSFAAVVYEMVTGERAFPGIEAMEVAQTVLNDEPLPPSEANRGAGVPSRVDQAILRGLRKDPDERYPDARSLLAALRHAYGLPVSKRPQIARQSSRRGLLLAAVSAAAVVAFFVIWGPAEPLGEPVSNAGEPAAAATETNDGEPSAARSPDPSMEVPPEPRVEQAPVEGDDALTPHEREEAAKDELARARRAIESNDFDTAEVALDRALEYDPDNPDIALLRSAVRDMRPSALPDPRTERAPQPVGEGP
jgi:serine/threonine protein kinase